MFDEYVKEKKAKGLPADEALKFCQDRLKQLQPLRFDAPLPRRGGAESATSHIPIRPKPRSDEGVFHERILKWSQRSEPCPEHDRGHCLASFSCFSPSRM